MTVNAWLAAFWLAVAKAGGVVVNTMALLRAREIGVILVLLVANGVFAAAEIAVVSSRRHRLTAMASRGDRGAEVAGELARDPGRFLSTVQVGITLVGVLAGAFGGATLAEEVSAWLATMPTFARYAEPIGFGVVVLSSRRKSCTGRP